MARTDNAQATRERTIAPKSGWVVLAIIVGLLVLSCIAFVLSIRAAAHGAGPGTVLAGIGLACLVLLTAIFLVIGLFTLQPNQARVLILFGSYKGTVRRPGFHFANPFYSRTRGRASSQSSDSPAASAVEVSKRLLGLAYLPTKISLRMRNFETDTLKVNDKRGNPVEIAAVIVWRVRDTARAVFDVEEFENYVVVQAESAIRSIASNYAYDRGEEDEITLRGGGDEVAAELTNELHDRLDIAGIEVAESRITHLAYAPEIASAMLRRQQAEAVIAARNKIVLGAVSMVEMALNELEQKAVIKLDEERRAAMVSNLLVVLCGTNEAAPVINTGTLYT
jgi:regulator of protease activity HflC (stomatin/prohibitin superfamily)